MLLASKPSSWRAIGVGHQHLRSTNAVNDSKHTIDLKASSSYHGSVGSTQLTLDLNFSKLFHGSVGELNGYKPVGLQNRQLSTHSWGLYQRTGSFLTKPTVCAHFEPCKNIHTASRLNKSNKDNFKDTSGSKDDLNDKDEQDTGGSRDNKALKMSTRIKIVTFLVATWAAVYFVANYNKDKKKAEERESEIRQIDIGASDYELVDQFGNKRTKKDFLGQWFLLYFGFTHCPDICPEELEKMAGIIDIIDSDKTIPDLLPVFVSVDPERDTPDVIGKYVAEFHKNFVGLTGTKEQIKQAAKAFRVYFSAGPRDEDNDYIIDHSIVMYLMSPQGNFVDYYGSRGVPTEKIVESIKQKMKNFKRFHG